MKRLRFVLTFVLLVFSLISCRGESPTLPPPPPGTPYKIELVHENYVGTLSNRPGRTSFVVIFSPKIIKDGEFMFETSNGRVLSYIENPLQPSQRNERSFIIFAEVYPDSKLRFELGPARRSGISRLGKFLSVDGETSLVWCTINTHNPQLKISKKLWSLG
jgi:hypothetical protein